MDFKEKLLNALKDKDVRNELQHIIHSMGLDQDSTYDVSITTENNAYTHQSDSTTSLPIINDDKLSQLEHENQQLKKIIEDIKLSLNLNQDVDLNIVEFIHQQHIQWKEKEILISELNNKLQVNSTLQNTMHELEQQLQIRDQKIGYYNEQFSDDLEIYKLYNQLSEQTRISLNGIFKDISIKGLVACGIQEKNISNLWDYAKNEIVNGTNNDIALIISLFELLFNRFILAYPMFALQDVKEGDSFDTHQHIKHNISSNTSGSITKVLLKGYSNNKTEKIIKASVVVI